MDSFYQAIKSWIYPLTSRLNALFSRSYRFQLADMKDGPGYLYLPHHPRKRDASNIVARSVRVRDIIEPYEGEDVILDFDAEGRLIGIEID